ncbi:MAG: hypothetical protein ABI806_06540 [Candidatus Solibacter sp.]
MDQATLWQLEAQPVDPRAAQTLRAAFERRTAKSERQRIAASLIRLGEKSAVYFEFLTGYAKAAINDRTPFFEKVDAEGNPVRGEFSAEFENWCAQNQKNPRDVAASQLGAQLEDVKVLAEVADPRAGDIFRRGLESPNPRIVAYSNSGPRTTARSRCNSTDRKST